MNINKLSLLFISALMVSTSTHSMEGWRDKLAALKSVNLTNLSWSQMWPYYTGTTALGLGGFAWYKKNAAKKAEQVRLRLQADIETRYHRYWLPDQNINGDKVAAFQAALNELISKPYNERKKFLAFTNYAWKELEKAYFINDRQEVSPLDAINMPFSTGLTPLMRAASGGDVELAKWLLAKGANPHLKVKGDGFKTALDVAKFQRDYNTRGDYKKCNELINLLDVALVQPEQLDDFKVDNRPQAHYAQIARDFYNLAYNK